MTHQGALILDKGGKPAFRIPFLKSPVVMNHAVADLGLDALHQLLQCGG